MKKSIRNHKGYSLVELIIVIAIMAILVGIITPQLLKYINKAKKAVDIQNAEAIGEAFTYAAMLDEDVTKYLNTYIAASGWNNTNHYYRVVAFANVPASSFKKYATASYVTMQYNPVNNDVQKNAMRNLLDNDVSNGTVPLRFERDNGIDQWVIACDKGGRIYVFVGSGLNNYRIWISKDEVFDQGGGRQGYMLWPETSQKYMELKQP